MRASGSYQPAAAPRSAPTSTRVDPFCQNYKNKTNNNMIEEDYEWGKKKMECLEVGVEFY